MGEFQQLLKKSNKKTNNHPKSEAAKIALRRHVLDGISQARVFDAFAGSGKMYRAVWHEAAAYTGCDIKWFRDERSVFVAKCQRVMRAIDLADYNVFDLDAYGSPWLQVRILAARRHLAPGEKFGLVLTDGSGLKLKMGQCPKAMAQLCGMDKSSIPGINRAHGLLIDQALAETCRLMGARIVARWEHDRPGKSEMKYLALLLEGVAQ